MRKKVDFNGSVAEYNLKGIISKKTFSNGLIWVYDENKNRRIEIYPDKSFREFDASGLIKQTGNIDENNHVYDNSEDLNKVVAQISSQNNKRSEEYEKSKEWRWSRREVYYGGEICEYDKDDKILRSVDVYGFIFEYYDNGKIKKMTNPVGHIYEYDENDKIKRETLPNGIIHELDNNEIIRRIIYLDGQIDEYDENENLIRRISKEGFIVLLDEKGRPKKMIKLDGLQGECIVDSEGNLQKTVWADGSLWLYDKNRNREEYDESGKLRRKKWLEKNIIEEYDESGRLAKTIFPDGTVKEGDINIKLKI